MKKYYTTSEARKVLSDLINQVKYQGKSFTIGRHGQIEAEIVPVAQAPSKNIHERVAERRKAQNANINYSSPLFMFAYQSLAKKYNLNLVVLFGSHTNGRVKADSDIDIAVSANGCFTSKDEMAIYNDFIQLFQRDDIDIVNLDRVHNVSLRYSIFSTGKILYEGRSGLFRKFLSRSFFEYQDFKRHLARYDKLLDKKLNHLIESVKNE